MGWQGGSGWGAHVNPWLIHVNVWQKPVQYCKIISLQLKRRIPFCQNPFHNLVEKEGNDLSALSDGSFCKRLPSVPVFHIVGFLFFLFIPVKCLLYSCRLRDIELETQEAEFQVTDFSTFPRMERCKSQG